MEERHKNWSRKLSKSFILKSPSNKRQPNLLHWKAHSKWAFSLSTLLRNTVPNSQKYFESFFPSLPFAWKDVYILPRIVTNNTRLRDFQYKVLNNALYLNKHIFIFKLSDTKLCSFCNQEDETDINLFANCSKSKALWDRLKKHFKDTINLPWLKAQSAIFGFLQTDKELILILNYLLLLFKYYWYVSRCSKTTSFAALKTNIKKPYILKNNLSKYDEKKKNIFFKKWGKISIYF